MGQPRFGYWAAALLAVVAGVASRVFGYGALFQHGSGASVGRPTLSELQETLVTLTFNYGWDAALVLAVFLLLVGARRRALEDSRVPPEAF